MSKGVFVDNAPSLSGNAGLDRRRAGLFVVLLGIVSLFGDMTYESARSLTGPFLALLGASATVVGMVAGLGELIGYALRYVSGRLADRSGQYWGITIGGYCLNLLAVPLLALAGNWQLAVALMFLERAGKTGSVPAQWIPIFYAIAMAVDGLAALVLGRLFDRRGEGIVLVAAAAAVPVAPLVFLGGFGGALAGAVLWGIGMGAQESVLKAMVAGMAPARRRATAFGIYNLSFGVFWFLGSALMGVLYDVSLTGLIVFSVLVQLGALPLLARVIRRQGMRGQ